MKKIFRMHRFVGGMVALFIIYTYITISYISIGFYGWQGFTIGSGGWSHFTFSAGDTFIVKLILGVFMVGTGHLRSLKTNLNDDIKPFAT